MTAFDPRSLYAKRDPSDPEDAVWYPGDDRSYPGQPPEQLAGWELELLYMEHADLTGATCTCGWCAYFEGRG